MNTLLFQCALKGTLILLLTFAAAALARRASAAHRHLLWMLEMIGLILLPVLTIMLPAWNAISIPAAAPTPMQSAPLTARFSTITTSTMRTPPSPVAAHPWDPSVLLIPLWLAGALLALTPALIGRIRLWRLAISAHAADDEMCDRLRRQLGIRRAVDVLRTDRRSMPMTWGVVRPHLLLPADSVEWPASKRRMVLAHELAHIERMDCLTQFIARLACAMHWFNPLAWLAAAQMAAAREAACDDRVLNLGADGPDYAEQLVRIAVAAPMRPILGAAAIGMARSSRLERRVQAILDSTISRKAVGPLRRWMTAIAALLLIAPIAMLRAGEVGTPPDFHPRLQFRLVVDSANAANADAFTAPTPGRPPLLVSKDVLLDERSVASASPTTDSLGHRMISINFTPEGGKEFAEVTAANVHHLLAVILDGNLLTAPTIQGPIPGGNCVISGGASGYTDAEANSIVNAIESAIQEADQGGTGARVRHFVTLVVAPDRMTFQGDDVTWDQLPDVLQRVPDRANTVLCVGYTSDQVTLAQFNEARFAELAQKYGFAYLSNIGQQPIGTKGRADQPVPAVAEVVRKAVNTISTCADGDPKVNDALKSLDGLPESEAVAQVATYLDSDTPEIRRSAIYILWRGPFHHIDPAQDRLQALCNHTEDLTRGMAALALGGQHIKSAEKSIIKMATLDESDYSRRCAAYALGLMGDPSPAVMEALDKLSSDSDPGVAGNAKAAIRMLRGQ
ncbi:MAG TPA: M56 family metallopeptidase [Tepidisphaeraceae bacterium]|nr:M56 family metallopeptidase [Tepidisphaeraceae bacterium]